MESKPVSTKQKESLMIILIDNVPVSISTKRYNHLIEWIDRYNSYQIGLEIYPPESNIHKQYAIKSKIALKTLKKHKNELQKKIQEIELEISKYDQRTTRTSKYRRYHNQLIKTSIHSRTV